MKQLAKIPSAVKSLMKSIGQLWFGLSADAREILIPLEPLACYLEMHSVAIARKRST
jgi:hypothetical protein